MTQGRQYSVILTFHAIDEKRSVLSISPASFSDLIRGELADHGFSVGCHTFSHPDLRRLSSEAIRNELVGSRALLEDRQRLLRVESYYFRRRPARMVISSRWLNYYVQLRNYPRRLRRAFEDPAR
jgi:hypothetical protein